MVSANGKDTNSAEMESVDPRASARQHGSLVFPKRFYKSVEVVPREGGFSFTLDGRTARTPARRPIQLPTRQAAEALAQEWAAVEGEVDPRLMPFTRLVNSVIDGVSHTRAEVLDEILRYVSSDLLFYRAAEPTALVRAQEAAWNPVVDRIQGLLQSPFLLAEGVVFVPQPRTTLDRFAEVAGSLIGGEGGAPFRLGALHVMTTLTGSALLATAVASDWVTAEQAWAAAHIDEDYQIAEWGEDADAAERRAKRWIDMRTAALLFRLVSA